MRLDTLRILCTIQVILGLEVNQMDIKGAYLNDVIKEEIYMRQPPEYATKDGKVCRLCRSLYGLKQSGRGWNRRFNAFLIKIGFKSATKEHRLYSRRIGHDFEIIRVWEDDLYLIAKTPNGMTKLKQEIHNEFEAIDQGVPKFMLGIKIEVDPQNQSIRLSQDLYIQKIINQFAFESEKISDVPMSPNLTLHATTDEDRVDVTKYQSAIGSLMYAAIATRSDIAFAVSTLAQFNVNLSKTHWNAVKKIFKYLTSSKGSGKLYDRCGGNAKIEVAGFTDAENRTGTNSGCPTSGGVYILAGRAIKWISERQ